MCPKAVKAKSFVMSYLVATNLRDLDVPLVGRALNNDAQAEIFSGSGRPSHGRVAVLRSANPAAGSVRAVHDVESIVDAIPGGRIR